jgi:hypothetical protein
VKEVCLKREVVCSACSDFDNSVDKSFVTHLLPRKLSLVQFVPPMEK